MHKKASKGDNSKSIKTRAIILYATHCHDLFYITVKYHQNIPNIFKLLCGHENVYGGTDRRQAHCYIPQPFGRGIKSLPYMPHLTL